MESYSLYELNEFIRQVMHLNFPDTLWLRAEIAQIKESRGQHYLTFIEKDADSEKIIAQIQAILWGRRYWQLRSQLKGLLDDLLQGGIAILVQVKVEFDERYGLKLIIEDIDPNYTIGQLALKKQKILQALADKGFLNKNNQLQLPPVVQRIAVLSSSSAAGMQDYLNQLEHNAYGYVFQNSLFPIAVQGIRVEKELLAQLKKIISRKAAFDAVIILRGGGSKIDLGVFDSFELGKAVANCPLPVIVGIGHEIDETILDKVAHTSLKTPTAVAEFLIQKVLHFESFLVNCKNFIQHTTTQRLQVNHAQLQQIQQLIRLTSKRQIKEQVMEVAQLQKRLPTACKNYFKNEQIKLSQLGKICFLLSPQTLLERGYSLTYVNGKIINSIEQAKAGMELETKLADGSIKSTVVQ